MAPWKDHQENINPLQQRYYSSVKSARPRHTLPISKPSCTFSKSQLKIIKNFERNTSSLTPTSKSKFSQRRDALVCNKLAKPPISSGIPPNVQNNIQSHPNSETAEVVNQQQEVHKHTSPPKRQRLEKVNDANDPHTSEERIEELYNGVQMQYHTNIQATTMPIPLNLTVHTGPEVPPKLANTPSGLGREQQNNGTYSFAMKLTQNNTEDFFESLKLDNIRLRKKHLTYLESEYRNNVDGITYSEAMQELKKEVNILKQSIERSERIRLDIAETKAILRLGKYICKKCKRGYEKPGNIFNHILASHPEIVEEYKLAQMNHTASTVIDDGASSLSSHSHSIHSHITLMDSTVSPQRVANAAFNLQKENSNQTQTERNPARKNISSRRNVNTRPEHALAKTTNPRMYLQTTAEIMPDNPLWKRIEINFVPRKPVDFLGHKSFELFEKNERMIRNWMKKSRSNNLTTRTNKNINITPRVVSGKNTTFHDGSVQINKYYLDLLYNKAELEQINHCYANKKIMDLCESCLNKLVEFQAKQYAVSKAAYDEYKKITESNSLSNEKKRSKIKKIINTRDEYSLIRERLQSVNAKRGLFKLNAVVVKYNRNYFVLLQKAFNDTNIQDYVQLDESNRPEYNLGIYCSKLMDDIVNEFLVQVTVICMNFAYQKRQVTLTKELLSQYQASFKMTNKDATYLEPCSRMEFYFEKNYMNLLPKDKNLEELIIDCLLRHCFGDNNTMHESLDELIFEHLKSPQPIFKFLMYMKFTTPYLKMITVLLLLFLFQLSVEVLKLKKEKKNKCLVTFEELIEACEIVGVFGSSYLHNLKKSYTQYFEAFVLQS
ncbi:uncharacterized protein LOC103316253 isoform X2 [Nasonia vitripennis]|uniref:C2H2-type domain-containing protein n=1 Tax=Nasonia vitripennis TaxID=7425 RepID=A0A7M7IYE4_NASVI|nr:uncharacterized protein LOC103316253 isoform X2 [Nasonia vitripennis]XP_016841131.1 uncharacterized protein LOC103316253 isoform X2 [Nasonia vitripennis]XP_031786967.1 uncharacterized protein LOC103316253 isoform X2 [Nasonia vitripennis]